MTLITMNGNKIVTKNGGIATETDCCACPCPTDTCTDSCGCAALTTPQPSIKVWDLGCEAWCTGGPIGTAPNIINIPGGSQSESIPYYASTNPTLINGCCYTLWELRSVQGNEEDPNAPANAIEQMCYNPAGSAPQGPITVTLKCCPGVPEYSIAYIYRHSPALANYDIGGNGTTFNNQKLCVVDGILKGCVVLDLDGSYGGQPRPNCKLRLVFGEA